MKGLDSCYEKNKQPQKAVDMEKLFLKKNVVKIVCLLFVFKSARLIIVLDYFTIVYTYFGLDTTRTCY